MLKDMRATGMIRFVVLCALAAGCAPDTDLPGGQAAYGAQAALAVQAQQDVQAAPGAQTDVVVVDSVFPMEIMLARFQASVPRHVTDLSADAARTRDELIARFVRAVEDSSLAALRALRLDESEYAWLYAPHSPLSREPYRQPPQLGWMLVDQNSRKGEVRVLQKYGGRPLGYRGYRCGAPVPEGANGIWPDCVLELDGHAAPLRLFGNIIERNGRYGFVSVTNDL